MRRKLVHVGHDGSQTGLFRSSGFLPVLLAGVLLFLFRSTLISAQEYPFDHEQMLRDVQVLAADSLLGRRTGTTGSKKAQRYLLRRIRETGIQAPGGEYRQPFVFFNSDSLAVDGTNLVGRISGTGEAEGAIVLTAHYDHLGRIGGLVIFNGADDNASGAAALLALAPVFSDSPLRHDLVFVWTDGEEIGFRGARALMKPGVLDSLNPVLNVNLDMISRNAGNELYTGGTYHYPELKRPLDSVRPAPPVMLLQGHDRPDVPGVDDWTGMSDHIVFHEASIPFVYFGVEDHPDYHRPTDDYENIDPVFFGAAVETIRRAIVNLDEAFSR